MLGRSIYSLLTNHEPLGDLIGPKVYPVQAPQRQEEPFVVYGIKQVEPSDDKLETSAEDYSMCEVHVYAKDYDQVHNIAKQVRAAMDGQKGTIAGNLISQIRFTDYQDGYEDDRQSYVGSIEFQIIAAP